MKKTWIYLAGGAVALGTVADASAQGTLSGVSVTKKKGNIEVGVQGQNLGKPQAFRRDGGRSYILEFKGKLKSGPGSKKVHRGGLAYVDFGNYRAGRRAPSRVRVHLSVAPWAKPTLFKGKSGWVVRLAGKKTPATVRTTPVALAARATAFPTSVPPLVPAYKTQVVLSQPVAKAAVKPATKPVAKAKAAQGQRVSLEFVNTEVVQILKALALQANVNIVASPDVKGPLTISLAKVPLSEALNLVTTLAGLKYAQLGNTYVVAKPNDLSRATRELVTAGDVHSETKVLSLVSGQGSRVRDAVLSTIPRADSEGWYDLLDGAAALATGPTDAVSGTSAPAGTKPASNDSYLVVVGYGPKLAKVVEYVQALDKQISQAQFPEKADIKASVVHIASGETERIKSTLERLIANNPRRADFSVTATKLQELAEDDAAQHVLMIMGPEAEVIRLKEIASALDVELARIAGIQTGPDGFVLSERFYEVVDLNFIEPRIAEHDLASRVRGLTVSVLPDNVSPRAKGRSSETRMTEAGDGGNSGEGGNGGGNAGGAAGGESRGNSNQTGTSTFERETGREPMKLLLRGTRAQIDEAKAYLRLVDLAPRQVAVELRVMEISREDAIRAGIDFNIFSGGAVKFIRLNNASAGTQNTAGIRIGGNDFGADVTVTLDKIANRNNLISRPNILVMDGRSSGVFIGDEVRFVESAQSTQNGVTVTTGKVDVGVKLDVGVRVGSNGNITLDLGSEVRFLNGFEEVPQIGGRLPQTSARRAGSTLQIQSGETIAIGGLISQQDIKRSTGVPILMDLPIVGQLFRRTNDERQRRELVIFVTAREKTDGTRVPTLPLQDDSKVGTVSGKGDK